VTSKANSLLDYSAAFFCEKNIEILVLEWVCFCWSSEHFWQKNPLLMSTLHKVISYKRTFYRAQWNLSLQHKIGWRPAEKIRHLFFQHASCSAKISTEKNSNKYWWANMRAILEPDFFRVFLVLSTFLFRCENILRYATEVASFLAQKCVCMSVGMYADSACPPSRSNYISFV
jgi:hypothetical protein